MSIKLERQEENFVKEISKILMTDVKDKNIRFVTITGAKISSDLSYAKIYFTCLDEQKKEEIVKTLNKAKNYLRTELCKKVNIRKMPELSFIYDESIEYGNKIEKIIENLKEENNNE